MRVSAAHRTKERGCRFPHLEAELPRLGKRPLLMIHGEADNYIKPPMAEALYQLASEPKEYWLARRSQAQWGLGCGRFHL